MSSHDKNNPPPRKKGSLGSHLGKSLRQHQKTAPPMDDDNRSRGLTDLQWEMDLEGAKTNTRTTTSSGSSSAKKASTTTTTTSSTSNVPPSPMQAPKRPIVSPHARRQVSGGRTATSSSASSSHMDAMSASMSALPHVPSLLMDATSTQGASTRRSSDHIDVNEGSTSTIDVSNNNDDNSDDDADDSNNNNNNSERRRRGTSSHKNNASLRAILELGAQQTKTQLQNTPGKEDMHSVALEDFHKYDDYVKNAQSQDTSKGGDNEFSARKANQNILNRLNYAYSAKDAKKQKRLSQFFQANPLNTSIDQSVNLMDAQAGQYSQRSNRTRGGGSFWDALFGSNEEILSMSHHAANLHNYEVHKKQPPPRMFPTWALLCVAVLFVAILGVVLLPQQLDRLEQYGIGTGGGSGTSAQGGAAVLTSALLGPFTAGTTAATTLDKKTNSRVAHLQHVVLQHGVSTRETLMSTWHRADDQPKTAQQLALLWWSQLPGDDNSAMVSAQHVPGHMVSDATDVHHHAFGDRTQRDVEHEHVLQRYALATLFFATAPAFLAEQPIEQVTTTASLDGAEHSHHGTVFVSDMAGVGGGPREIHVAKSGHAGAREVHVRTNTGHRTLQGEQQQQQDDHPMANWLVSSNVCDWGGVKCNAVGLVTELRLSSAQLDGTLPTQELMAALRGSLKKLDLSDNALTGSLDVPLVWLYLTDCDVSSNQFQGSVPTWLVHSPKLQRVYLEHNRIEGYVPSSVCLQDTFHPQTTALTHVAADCKGLVQCQCCNDCY